MKTIIKYMTTDVSVVLWAKVLMLAILVISHIAIILTLGMALWYGIAGLPILADIIFAVILIGYAFMIKLVLCHMHKAIESRAE